MAKATITSKEYLTEGGCNACGFINCKTTTIEFNTQITTTLDDLDLDSLVMATALENGWQQVMVPVGIGEEELVIKKDGTEIALAESGEEISYQKDGQKTTLKKYYDDPTDLFQKTNQVLQDLFSIEPYEFEIVE